MKPLRDVAYREFVRTFPCCLKGQHSGDVAAHHAFGMFGGGGKGLKGSDYLCVPVCDGHHQSLHSQGLTSIDRCLMLYSIARLLSEYTERKPNDLTPRVTSITIGSAAAMISEGFGTFLQSNIDPIQSWIDIGTSYPASSPVTLAARLVDEGIFDDVRAMDAAEVFCRLRCGTNVAFIPDNDFNSYWDDIENQHGLDVEDVDWVYCPSRNMIFLRSGLTGDDNDAE